MTTIENRKCKTKLTISLIIGGIFAGLAGAGATTQPSADPSPPASLNNPAFTEHWSGEWEDEPSALFNLGPLEAAEDPESPTPPLKGAYLARFEANAQVLRDIRAGKPLPPGAGKFRGCPPVTMPLFMFGGTYPTEIAVSDVGIIMVSEFAHDSVRRIFTDGRKAPTGYNLLPSHMGYSVGRWEGKTLVVDTTGLVAGKTDMQAEHSDAAHITERFRLTDQNTLEDQITIEDPEAQTGPWTTTRHYQRQPASVQPIESDCEEGERNF